MPHTATVMTAVITSGRRSWCTWLLLGRRWCRSFMVRRRSSSVGAEGPLDASTANSVVPAPTELRPLGRSALSQAR